MELEEKLLEMLSSNYPQVRYVALEQLRDSKTTSEAIVEALEKATHDDDQGISEKAKLALQADVHHQMEIKMGAIELNKIQENNNIRSTVDQSSSSRSQFIESSNVNIYERRKRNPTIPEEEYSCFEYCQSITLSLLLFPITVLIASLITGSSVFLEFGILNWIWIFLPIPFIGLQIYAIKKYGWRESYSFLKWRRYRGGRKW